MTQEELQKAKQLEKDIKDSTYRIKAVKEIFDKAIVRVKSDTNINQNYLIPDEFKTIFRAILLDSENNELKRLEKLLESI